MGEVIKFEPSVVWKSRRQMPERFDEPAMVVKFNGPGRMTIRFQDGHEVLCNRMQLRTLHKYNPNEERIRDDDEQDD